MSDIREGSAPDPYREPLADPGSVLRPETPPGSEITLNDDGTATFDLGEQVQDAEDEEHFANLADGMDVTRLSVISMELLDAIEVDKEARKRRDAQYTEGLRRTGLGDDAPGGAPFAGASRAVHPMLTEAIVDYSARVVGELLPPEGPVKAHIIGAVTQDKSDRAERTARYLNWQLTEMMSSAYSELEQGFSQEGLAGAFYTKFYVNDGQPDIMVVHIDQVHRPWGDGDFYSQQRITHEQSVDKWTFQDNVESGLWLDVVETSSSADNIEETDAQSANDRVIGRDLPTKNIDDNRTVYEISTRIALEEGEPVLPYLITIDEQTRRILSIYRNWEEGDENRRRLDFLIEWPFWPWRGGYPIGLAHMIGSLSGAASGSLRALLDSALLNTMQTGVKLKGGATAGGQNIRAQVGQTTEVSGSLSSDDIRKTYMPLPFPQPSPVLFQLLGFLTDAGRGVIRTTFDEFNNVNNETPVGTANMMIEQGLKSFGAVFTRQHRSMKRMLRQLWKINQKTIESEEIQDNFGELLVTKEDFTGPMAVQPVSDPRIFSETQRQAQAQLVASRAQLMGPLGLYKLREAELFLLRSMKVPSPEQFLTEAPQPTQVNAATENVLASQGMPIKAFMGQDHEAHIAQHGAFMDSPLFGSNQAMAQKFLPPMIQHIADHLSLWYADAMLLATNDVLQKTFKDPRITLEALQTIRGLEVQLDRLMAELTPAVMQHAQQALGPSMEILTKAQALMKQLQPPMPMDPSVVAQQDVQRQSQTDQANIALKKQDQDRKAQQDVQTAAQKAQEAQAQVALAAKKQEDEAAAKQREIEQRADQAEDQHLVAAAGVKVQDRALDVKLQTTEEDNETALEIADKNLKARNSAGNIRNGEGVGKS